MNCVVSFVDAKLKKNRFPRIRTLMATRQVLEALNLNFVEGGDCLPNPNSINRNTLPGILYRNTLPGILRDTRRSAYRGTLLTRNIRTSCFSQETALFLIIEVPLYRSARPRCP